ncbi:MAG: hypothetical protein R3E79_26085 [Caldilineaceae bacterium]
MAFSLPRPVTDWNTAKVADTKRFATFFQAMLEEGVYVAPSQFPAGFPHWHMAPMRSARRFRRWRAFAKL